MWAGVREYVKNASLDMDEVLKGEKYSPTSITVVLGIVLSIGH